MSAACCLLPACRQLTCHCVRQVDATFDAMTGSSGRLSKMQAAELLSAGSNGSGNGNGLDAGRLRETADLIWSEMRLPADGQLDKVCVGVLLPCIRISTDWERISSTA